MGRGFISNINIAPRPQHRPTCFSFHSLQNSEVGRYDSHFTDEDPELWGGRPVCPVSLRCGGLGMSDRLGQRFWGLGPGQRCQMPPFLPSPQVTSSPALLPHRRPYSQATLEPALTHTPSSGRPVVSPILTRLGD